MMNCDKFLSITTMNLFFFGLYLYMIYQFIINIKRKDWVLICFFFYMILVISIFFSIFLKVGFLYFSHFIKNIKVKRKDKIMKKINKQLEKQNYEILCNLVQEKYIVILIKEYIGIQ